MLLQLDIQNIALIDKLSLEIAPGLNVLTGETGAGKINFNRCNKCVLGERVTKDLIRNARKRHLSRQYLSPKIYILKDILEELGVKLRMEILLFQAKISMSGKNTCRINGRLVNLSVLKQVGELLLDIHGQHDNQYHF